ncbi:MAG: hypothetical protein PHT62_14385 [Desulfotomaculaceae bacterium]|nr:hypothetical protein [Desulfotomaculaceae bacterium]
MIQSRSRIAPLQLEQGAQTYLGDDCSLTVSWKTSRICSNAVVEPLQAGDMFYDSYLDYTRTKARTDAATILSDHSLRPHGLCLCYYQASTKYNVRYG